VASGDAVGRPVRILLFPPEELQGDTHLFQFLIDISVTRLGIHGFLHELVRIEHTVNRVFIHVSDIFVGDAIFICFGNTSSTELTETCLVRAMAFHPIPLP